MIPSPNRCCGHLAANRKSFTAKFFLPGIWRNIFDLEVNIMSLLALDLAVTNLIRSNSSVEFVKIPEHSYQENIVHKFDFFVLFVNCCLISSCTQLFFFSPILIIIDFNNDNYYRFSNVTTN